jgi:HTH-type transcriptional regulator, competence development regulator
MSHGSRRPPQRRKRSRLDGPRSQLGGLLADLRATKGFTLRQVEEATGNAVSNAYLSQLEKGRVQKPSPNVLHSLALVYAVPYESLMGKAGYLAPSDGDGARKHRRLSAFALDDLSAEEEMELLRYLAFLRSRKPAQ